MYCGIKHTSECSSFSACSDIDREKTKIGSENACFLTRLDTDQMGTYEDIK